MTIILVIMAKKHPFALVYAAQVRQHLRGIDAKYHSLIRSEVEAQLLFEPNVETRNRKPLQRLIALGVDWEIRFGPDNRFRVFYQVSEPAHEVRILAIGEGSEPAVHRRGGDRVMKIASVADVKARFSAYVKESLEGPVIVTRNGKPVAVLVAVTDEDDLERLVLAHSPKFQAILEASRREIDATGGTAHDAFWREVDTDSRSKGRNGT